MDEFRPNTFYMTIREKLTQSDGTESFYARLMYNPCTWYLMDGWISTSKAKLKDKIIKRLSMTINLDDFTVTESKNGWVFERYIRWHDDGNIYELVEKGEHSDHEVYAVEIEYYESVANIMTKLED